MKKLLVSLLAVVAVLLCACGKGGDAKPLPEIYNDIKAQVAFEDVTELSEIRLMERYFGITDAMVTEYAGCSNTSSGNLEAVVLVKAVDDASAASVKEKLDTYYQSKLNQSKNYNPEQAAMIEKCSVTQDGLYVSMIISDKADQITKIYRTEAGLQ